MNKMNVFKGSDEYVVTKELMNAVNVSIALQKPLLIKGEEEEKKAFKKRMSEQKEQMMQRLFTPEERVVLEKYLTEDEIAQKHWEDRVLGKVKDPEDIEREQRKQNGGKKA